jgi:hypothetical protein
VKYQNINQKKLTTAIIMIKLLKPGLGSTRPMRPFYKQIFHFYTNAKIATLLQERQVSNQ